MLYFRLVRCKKYSLFWCLTSRVNRTSLLIFDLIGCLIYSIAVNNKDYKGIINIMPIKFNLVYKCVRNRYNLSILPAV